FVSRTEMGLAQRRADAEPERLRAATAVFGDPRYPPARGIAAAVFSGVLTCATFVSDSLGAGAARVVVRPGRIPIARAVVSYFLGTFFANLLIFVGARCVSAPRLKRPPLRWLFSPAHVARNVSWIQRLGLVQSIWSLPHGHRRTTTVAMAHAR